MKTLQIVGASATALFGYKAIESLQKAGIANEHTNALTQANRMEAVPLSLETQARKTDEAMLWGGLAAVMLGVTAYSWSKD